MLILFSVGAAFYLYAAFVAKAVKKTYLYVGEAIRKLNGTTVQVTLKPQGEKLAFTAGQFMFVRFGGDRVMAEPHPFIVSSAPPSGYPAQ
jgi:predicted ferric reductase